MRKSTDYPILAAVAAGALLTATGAWAAHSALNRGDVVEGESAIAWTEPTPRQEGCVDPAAGPFLEMRLEAAAIESAAAADGIVEDAPEEWLAEQAAWMEILDRSLILAEGARAGASDEAALGESQRFAAHAALFQAELIWSKAQAALELTDVRNPEDMAQLEALRTEAARAAHEVREHLALAVVP